MIKTKIKINKIIIPIFALLHVVDCFSLYYELIGYQIIQIINMALLFLLVLINWNKFSMTRRESKYVLSYVSIVFILFIAGDFKHIGFITGHFIPCLLMLILLTCSNRNAIIRTYINSLCNVIFFVSFLSLLFYLIGTNLNIILPNAKYDYSTIGWADFDYKSYYGLYFEGQRTFFFGKTIIRNIGLFVEAPVFAYVLITALFCELFWKNKISIFRVAILSLTIISSFSTTGITICLILILVYLYQTKMKKSFWKLFAPIAFIVVVNITLTIVFDKLAIGNDSGSTRIDDLYACFKCFIHNPIIGRGFNDVKELDMYRSSFRLGIDAGVSNGLPFVLANGGVLFGIVYWGPMVIMTVKLINNKVSKKMWGFVFVQFALLFFTITQYTLLAETLLVIAWIAVLYPSDSILIDNNTISKRKRKHEKHSFNYISRSI